MSSKESVSLLSAISIGIGGMVGGGIFAVLGLATVLAKGGTPIAFLFAGLIALITAYSYVKLSLAYPDTGGTVRFVNEGFGIGIISGGVNNLLWVSYIIMLALYASAFGSYAPNLFALTSNKTLDTHLYASAIVLIASAINYYSITVVGRIESIAVIIKLIILLGFCVICAYGLIGNPNLEQLNFQHWESPLSLITAGMIIFVAYEGFELIANAAPNMDNPQKNIPRAYYISVIFVILLYLTIAVITVGSLPFSQIGKAQDYVLAEAAKPMLGQFGFTVITIAALISTFSAINASLLGGSRVSYKIADDGELPRELTRQLWGKPIGLMLTMIGTLILVNSLNLETISIAGSVGFLLIFTFVNAVAWKKSASIQGKKPFPLLGVILGILAIMALLSHTLKTDLTGFLVAFGIVVACFIIEFLYPSFSKDAK